MNYSTCSTSKLLTLRRAALGAALYLAAVVFAADFGVANWGMTADQVKQLETRPNLTPFGQSDYLIYAVTLPGIENTRLIYQFNQGQLVEGRFIFKASKPLDVLTYLQQYEVVKSLISQQYGPPNTDQVLVRNSADGQPMANEYVNELASDRLILKSSWRSPSALIRHQLAWNGDRPHHQLYYRPSTANAVLSNSEAF